MHMSDISQRQDTRANACRVDSAIPDGSYRSSSRPQAQRACALASRPNLCRIGSVHTRYRCTRTPRYRDERVGPVLIWWREDTFEPELRKPRLYSVRVIMRRVTLRTFAEARQLSPLAWGQRTVRGLTYESSELTYVTVIEAGNPAKSGSRSKEGRCRGVRVRTRRQDQKPAC